MKRVLSVLLAGVMTFSLAACGGDTKNTDSNNSKAGSQGSQAEASKTEEAGANDEQVTIRMSWWGGEARHKATENAINAFMEKNPNIKVEPEYGAWDGWPEKVATQLSGGTAPDLMQINWNWLYQFSSDGSKFADLNKLGVNLEYYPENLLTQCYIADKQQAVPIGTTGKVFFWNKTTFDQAGLEIPKTIDDLLNAGKVFQEKLGDDYYPMAMYQYERMIFMLYYLGSKYDMNWVVDGKPQYSVEQVKEGLDWLCSLEDAHVLPTITMLQGDGATILEKNAKWGNGRYAGFYEWDSANQKMKDALEPGQEFVVGDFLTGIGDHTAGLTKVSQTFAITETSEHKEAAAQLLDFLVNDDEGIKLLGLERGMLANSHANEVLEKEGLFENNLTYEANQAVMAVATMNLDPNFEHSELKDSTGVYYDVMETISNDHSKTQEMAEYLLSETERVQSENPY